MLACALGARGREIVSVPGLANCDFWSVRYDLEDNAEWRNEMVCGSKWYDDGSHESKKRCSVLGGRLKLPLITSTVFTSIVHPDREARER